MQPLIFKIAVSIFAALLAQAALAQGAADKGAEARFFIPSVPGVVKDTRTGLEWMRCSLGQDWQETRQTCVGEIKMYQWRRAQTLAAKINELGGYAGYSNWRLPTIRELAGIRYCEDGMKRSVNLRDGGTDLPLLCAGGVNMWNKIAAVPSNIFPRMGAEGYHYWSATLVSGEIWGLRFNYGDIGSRVLDESANNSYGMVLLVRE